MGSDKRVARLGRGPAGRHLTADQLMEAYVLASDPPHLADCALCRQRFDEIVRPFEQLREDALHEADRMLPPERLQEQRDRIMRRLERHDRPAEVVRFPQRNPVRPAVRRVLGPARRWVAGAAAAGLAAGMFLGFAMDRRTHVAATQPAPAAAVAWQEAPSVDDQFFLEIEEALVGSRVREMRPDLGAIDAMTTPAEIRDVSYVR